MTDEERTWEDVKAGYLREVEKALSSVKHPRIKEVLADVREHLERRFAELGPENRDWEGFQSIITDMGPARDYAELLAEEPERAKRSSVLEHIVLGALAVLVTVAVVVLLQRSFQKRSEAPETVMDFLALLNEPQKLYLDWTRTRFASFLDGSEYAGLSASARKELQAQWLRILEGSKTQGYYRAINGLGCTGSKEAVEPLLKIAVERREKDNRDRWMATRALGIVGDDSIVPELIGLVYHYNQNTRFWAQISLVRLTGVNFGSDWRGWAKWWNKEKGNPPLSFEKIPWTSNTQWADEQWQQEQDRAFVERLQGGGEAADAPSVATYIVTFKPVEPFAPRTARYLLAAFNEKHPRGVRTHHYRTRIEEGKLVGLICVDTASGRDAVVGMLKANNRLSLVQAVAANRDALDELYEMRQVSLPEQQPGQGHIPATSRIDEDGRIVDKTDYPFVNDPALIGTWETVDFVSEIDDFRPGVQSWQGSLRLKEVTFFVGGRTSRAWRWTKGLVIHDGDRTAAKYQVEEIDGSEYMFLEWKSGDYTIRRMKPKYYVLRKE
jgi:hypothetical protein